MFIPDFPLHVVFILGTRCNLSCIHCSSAAGRKGDLGFSTLEAERIIDQLAEIGVVDIALSGGEPLLRNDLSHLIRYTRSLGLTVGTSTNGTPLTPRRANELRAAGLCRLQVSIDGPKAIHDSIRGAGSFEKAIRAVRISIESGLRTHVCFTAMKHNAEYLEQHMEMCIGLGIHGFNLSQFVPTGRGTRELDVAPLTSRGLLETWDRVRKRHPDLYFSAHSAGLADLGLPGVECGGGCQAGIGIACITATGDVTPCVMFPQVLGNLNESTFREIWRDSPIVRLLKSRDVKGVCGSCPHRIGCGGCRAASWALTGDPMAGDPRCWRNSQLSCSTEEVERTECHISLSIAQD